MCSDIHNSLVYDVVDLHLVPTVMEKHGKNLVMEMGKTNGNRTYSENVMEKS